MKPPSENGKTARTRSRRSNASTVTRSHTQGLRTGSAETLCAACHNNQQTQLKHSIHGIGGVDCGSCHMAKEQKNTAGGASTAGAEIEASSHSFSVPTDVCNRCHSNTIHPTGGIDRSAALPPSCGLSVMQAQR